MSYTQKFVDTLRDCERLGPYLSADLEDAVTELLCGDQRQAIRAIATHLAAQTELELSVGFSQAILHAKEQALGGKGQERHGGVDEGDWIKITSQFGTGFLLGQAYKKILEAPRLDPTARRRELLGAIVYCAFAYIHG